MRKGVKVKQLGRLKAHREAMFRNLVTSALWHEQIETTLAKAKVARSLLDKLITRAKYSIGDGITESQKLHNIRIAARVVRDKEVLHKLFNDIAPRFTNRNGGYTRVLRLGARASDSAEMAVIELVERKSLVQLKEERKAFRESLTSLTSKTETAPVKK